MAISPKTLVKVAGIVGSCVGVPLILRKANLLGGNSQAFSGVHLEIKTIEKKLTNIEKTSAKKGNCQVEELTKDHKDFLLAQKQGGFYVEVLCGNTSVGVGVGSLSRDWTGLFPAQLLKRGEELSIGEEFDLKTQDASEGNIFRTIFNGQGMKEPITGTWGKESVTSVSFLDKPGIKNKLYLFFH